MNEGANIRVLDTVMPYMQRYVGKQGTIIEIVDQLEEVVVSFPGDQDAAFKWNEIEVVVSEDQRLRAAGEPTLPGLDERQDAL